MYPHHVETVLGAGFASRSHRVHSDSKVSMTRDQQLEMIRQKCSPITLGDVLMALGTDK